MMHDADQVADCVRYLTDLGARFDHLTSWNLESTIKYAPRACSLYIRSGAPQYNGEGLHTMAALGCIGGLELLLSVSANGLNRKDSEGFDPASIAAERGHINTLAWLLRKGAKVSDTLWDTLHKTGFLALENVIAGNVPYSVRQERGLPGWTSGTVRWMDFYDGCIVSRDGVDVFFSRDAVEEGDYVCALEQGTDVTFILAPSIVPVASRVKLISLTPLR
jgi:hypothetical protein